MRKALGMLVFPVNLNLCLSIFIPILMIALTKLNLLGSKTLESKDLAWLRYTNH